MADEKRRKRGREWEKKNPQRYRGTPEQLAANRRRWAERNPERDRESRLAWDKRNRAHRLAHGREYRNTPEAKQKARVYRLKAQYGVTHEQFDGMLEAQGGVCAICHKPETRMRGDIVQPLVVDHDHRTGAVRALLCHRCNASIGFLEECPDRMRAMASYIEGHNRRDEDGGA